MRLNNKGFAITVVLYGLLILFVALTSSYLLVLSARKNRIDNLVSDIEKEYNKDIINSDENSPVSTPQPDNDEKNVLTITLNKDGGEGGDNIIYYSNGNWYSDSNATNRIENIQTPQKSESIFDGFYEGKNGGGTKIIDEHGNIDSSVSLSESKEIYAKWSMENVTITIDLIGKKDGTRDKTIDSYSETIQNGSYFTHTFTILSDSIYSNKTTYQFSNFLCNGHNIGNITDNIKSFNREITATINSVTENLNCKLTLIYVQSGTM